jgi:hypothetical protein
MHISAWSQINNWFNSQASATQQMTAANDAANSAFASAATNFWQGMASLAATAALNRTLAEAAAKTAALKALTAHVGTTVNKVA